MKKIPIVSLLILFTFLSNTYCSAQAIWTKYITHADSTTVANDILLNADGSMVVVGFVRGNGYQYPDSMNSWVVKLDSSRNVLWKHTFKYSNLTKIIASDDGSYLCVGRGKQLAGGNNYHGGTYDVWMIKVGNSGNVIWSKFYGGSLADEGQDAVLLHDGGIAVTTSTFSSDGDVLSGRTTKTDQDVWVFKTNRDGVLQWEKCFNYRDSTAKDIPVNILETNDQKLLVYNEVLISTSNTNRPGIAYLLDPLTQRASYFGSFNGVPGATNNGNISAYYSLTNITLGINDGYSVCKTYDGAGYYFLYREKCPPEDGGSYPYYNNIVQKVSSDGSILSRDTIRPFYRNYFHPVFAGDKGITSLPGDKYVLTGCSEIDYAPFHDEGFVRLGNDYYGLTSVSGQAQLFSCKALPGDEGVIAVGYTGSANEYNAEPETPVYYSAIVTKFINFNTISGTIYVDRNNNNVQDAGETSLKNVRVNTTGTTSQFSTQPNNVSGSYKITGVGKGTFVTKVQLPSSYYTVSPDSAGSVFNSFSQSATANFVLHPIAGIKDYAVTAFNLNRVRPGFDNLYHVTYSNEGTDTLNNKNVVFIKDSHCSFLGATPSPASVSGDTITWNISSLLPNTSSAISLKLETAVIPDINIGDTMRSIVYIDSTGDVMTTDNLVRLAEIVGGSYDPNDKQENYAGNMPLKDVVEGNKLDYLIRFQNTGTDTAFTVVVRDTLDTKLDAATFSMIASSHSCQLNIKDGKYITWTFKDIKLLDSFSNETLSHGYITYSIKPKLPIGIEDEIQNSAAIYFDYNPPIITNTSRTVIKGTPTTTLWTGAVSTAWEDPMNWSNGLVPDINTVVTIPSVVPRYPEVSSNAACYRISVMPSASVLVKTGFKLKVVAKN